MSNLQNEYRSQIQTLKDMLFKLSFGDIAPSDPQTYLLWWTTRESFYRTTVQIPTTVPGRIKQKAKTQANKLLRKFHNLLENPDKRHRLPTGPLNPEEEQKARQRILSILRKLAGKPERKLHYKQNTKTEDSIESNDPKTIDIPLVLQLKINPSQLNKGDKLLNAIRTTLEKNESIEQSIRDSKDINVLLTDTESISVALPKSLNLSNEEKKVSHPFSLHRVKKAIKLYFKRQIYTVEWLNGQWLVTIPAFEYNKRSAIFKVQEDSENGIGDTGLTFTRVC